MYASMTREQIESLADRAAQNGEHSMVATAQSALSSTTDPEQRKRDVAKLRRYMRELSR